MVLAEGYVTVELARISINSLIFYKFVVKFKFNQKWLRQEASQTQM